MNLKRRIANLDHRPKDIKFDMIIKTLIVQYKIENCFCKSQNSKTQNNSLLVYCTFLQNKMLIFAADFLKNFQ
jgi:hypothetical protein